MFSVTEFDSFDEPPTPVLPRFAEAPVAPDFDPSTPVVFVVVTLSELTTGSSVSFRSRFDFVLTSALIWIPQPALSWGRLARMSGRSALFET